MTFHVTDFSNENIIIYTTQNGIKSINTTSNETWMVRNEVLHYTALTAAHFYVYYALLLPNTKGNIVKTPLIPGKPEKITETGRYKKIDQHFLIFTFS